METLKFWTNKYDFQSSYCNIVTKELLYNDIYEYTILSKVGCDNIRAIINKVKLSPLSYNVKFSETETTNFVDLIEILKQILSVTQNLVISEIESSTNDDGSWNFTPYITLQNDFISEIYVDPEDPIFDLDLYPLKNFKYLSNSDLTLYAHQKSQIPESIVINLFGIYIVQQKYESIIPEIQSAIRKYQEDGYQVLKNLENFSAFTTLWNINPIQDQIYQTDLEPEWIYNSIIDIKMGQLPQYQITGDWQFKMTHKNMAFLYYSFLRFYCGRITINPALLHYVDQIKILPDFSILAHFGKYEETIGFNPQISDLQSLQFGSYSQAFSAKLQLDSQNKIISIIKEIEGKYYLIWDGTLDSYLKKNSKDLLVTSNDKILQTIIFGANIIYQKLYLSGILSTDITSGFLALEDLKYINSNLSPWDINLFIYGLTQ